MYVLCIPNQKGQHCLSRNEPCKSATRAHCINHIPYTMLEQKCGNVCLPAQKKIQEAQDKVNIRINIQINIHICYIKYIFSINLNMLYILYIIYKDNK